MNKSLVKPVFLLFAITVLIVSCSKPEAKLQKFTLDGRVQGTYYHIVYYHFDDKAATQKNLLTQAGIQHGIDSIFKAIDETLSLWNPNSILSKVNENKETLLNQIFIDNFNSAMAFSELTDGDFEVADLSTLLDLLAGDFAAGVAWAALASIAGADQVASAIADALDEVSEVARGVRTAD